ncbi:MAG: hypothetical protein MUE39_10535 [Gammaproteobacteria bacterium]|jgi:hypothetical protein|nr:hypothetical protein [Gammaproteobacteria bacterium]
MDIDTDGLRDAVQRNCHIADARHAGDLGMCSYLMRMREYFRWERGLDFEARLANEEIGEWLDAREALWAALDDADYAPLEIDGRHFDPFDAEGVNAALERAGLVYSAGLVHGAKAHFFLGRLERRAEGEEGFTLRVAGRELARGLSAPPAMLQGHTIYVRRDSLRRLLWEKLETWRWSRADNGFARAFALYDFERDLGGSLDRMTDDEVDAAIEHEIGEFHAGRLLGPAWNDMLLDLAGSPAELMARAVRDHVADCTRTLPMLARTRREGSLHFYFGNLSGMRSEIFPGLAAAYREWLADGDYEPLGAIAQVGREHWLSLGHEMLDLHRAGARDVPRAIARLVGENVL